MSLRLLQLGSSLPCLSLRVEAMPVSVRISAPLRVPSCGKKGTGAAEPSTLHRSKVGLGYRHGQQRELCRHFLP